MFWQPSIFILDREVGDMAQNVTWKEKFLYSLPAFPSSFATFPVYSLVIPFYATEMGIPLQVVGLILLLTRLTDVVTDPIIGVLSDKTRSPIGRRRPYIIIGIPILMLSVWNIFVPGESADTTTFFIWMFLLWLGYTFVTLPYGSWGAELSEDYDERSSIKAYRGMAEMMGTMTAMGVPLLLSLFGYTDTATYLFFLAALFIALQPFTYGITLWKLREPPAPPKSQTRIRLWPRIVAIFSNKALLILCAGFICFAVGLTIGASLNLIFLTEFIGQGELFPLAIFIENVVGVLSIPIWIWLSKQLGKHIAAVIAVLWFTTLTALTWFLQPGDGYYFVGLIALRGATLGALFFLGAAMMADIVDDDELRSGEQRTALFFAILGMLLKLAGTLGVVLASFVPPMFGFQPSNEVHSEEALFGLRMVFAFIGAPFGVIAAILFFFYPIDRRRQIEIQTRLNDARLQVNSVPAK